MRVAYKCSCCEEQTIDVPNRRPNSDPAEWMELVQHCMGADHYMMSPNCRTTACEYMKIEMDEGTAIGMPRTVN